MRTVGYNGLMFKYWQYHYMKHVFLLVFRDHTS